ncbi:uncharacterized protein [Littorina saxatilis]
MKSQLSILDKQLEQQHARNIRQDLTIEQLTATLLQQDKFISQQVSRQDHAILKLNDELKKHKQTSEDLRVTVLKQARTIELLRTGVVFKPGGSSESSSPEQTAQGENPALKEWFEVTSYHVIYEQSDIALSAEDRLHTTNAPENASQPHVRRRSDDVGPVISHMTQQITEMTAEIQALKNANVENVQARGTTYVRWGHSSCPGTSDMIYSGIIGGSHQKSVGGAGNHLCMTSHPVFDTHAQPSLNGHAYVYGSEYDICPEAGCDTTPACAVCRVPHSSSVVIPGTNACTVGWTKEYSGYIMAGYPGYPGSSEFICVDSEIVHVHGSQTNDDENDLYYTHAKCGALPCPPYEDEKIVTCVVCSK